MQYPNKVYPPSHGRFPSLTSTHIIITMIFMIMTMAYNCMAQPRLDVIQKQILMDSDNNIGSSFGEVIATKSDFIFTGRQWAKYEYIEGVVYENMGAVDVFIKDTIHNKWVYHQTLRSDILQNNALFGSDVAISGDYLAISAMIEQRVIDGVEIANGKGAIYIYKLSEKDNKWFLNQKITTEGEETITYFGANIEIDGKHMFIYEKNTTVTGEDDYDYRKVGALAHFILDTVLEKWIRQDDIPHNELRFKVEHGKNITLQDKRMIITDTARHTPPELHWHHYNKNGVVYIYEYDENDSIWALENTVYPKGNNYAKYLGSNPLLHDNEFYVYQRQGLDPDNRGSIYWTKLILNRYALMPDNTLTLIQQINPPSNIHWEDMRYVFTVKDKYLVTSSWIDGLDKNGENELDFAGSVHIYTRSTKSDMWVYDQKIVAEKRISHTNFGSTVTLFDNELFVTGMVYDKDENGNDTDNKKEAIYVFEIDTTRSSVTIADMGAPEPRITVSPNPISDISSIGIPAMGDVRVYLTDITGATVREIWSGTADVPTSVMMDAKGLATGEYFVVVESEAIGVMSVKIVVER